MKFMKLGSRPDTFYTTDAISDLIIQLKGARYLLHKFPLLSKCLRLQRLCSEITEPSRLQIIQLPDLPGGVESFDLCAKFCYGITITLSAYNIVSTRCAAEYLQMSEDVDRGNLIYKIEVFFNSCILHGWRDSIVTLLTTKAYPTLSEDLRITPRCIDAVASKVLSRPTKASLSHSYSRRARDDDDDDVSCIGSKAGRKEWWAEDLAELGIDLYWRTMIAIKSGGNVPAGLIGDALRIYASRWLPKLSNSSDEVTSKHRLLLDSIITLLPGETKGRVSCSFLLKLLKAANILGISSSSKKELVRRIGVQLEEASVNDLLIPSFSTTKDDLAYDVDVVVAMLEHFMAQGQSPPTSPPRTKGDFERRRSRSAENVELMVRESRRSSSASHSSKLKVAKLIDRYLQRIAKERNLSMSKFITIAEAIPEFSRIDHDDLYKAIDVFLKGHPEVSKSERKRLCRVLECRKLSMEACMHAAQNEMLPLRVVVQVLFLEQARAGGKMTRRELPSNIKALLAVHNDDDDDDDESESKGAKAAAAATLKMRMETENKPDIIMAKYKGHKSSSKGDMLGKLWPITRRSESRRTTDGSIHI
ncbi:BTB/POZ domain-containing protein At1g67900-like isoform X2 [Andrographis paniculata]|uniref:BTB/POZ domain-containing protein At1g67900-like isoform X2 n=1 Tax=Andrographis paniculata TaxID=175694 RepID=UPI0021E97397|nr:BTB/POZ domain-containing protein At1g67900-like isoform X2 [Andrographis paniculata]